MIPPWIMRLNYINSQNENWQEYLEYLIDTVQEEEAESMLPYHLQDHSKEDVKDDID